MVVDEELLFCFQKIEMRRVHTKENSGYLMLF